MVSDHVLFIASERYGFDMGTSHFITDSTNQIYALQKAGKWYILRLSQRAPEHAKQTEAEMDWLYYLASHGINVSLPLPTGDGALVTVAEDESNKYILSAYEMLTGRFWDKNNPDLWNERIFYQWGKLTGDLHRLTKEYVPPRGNAKRADFTGWSPQLDVVRACPSVCAITTDLIAEIMALPKDRDSYGLIHYDIHPWNFLIEGDAINVFDFDDSLYGWFALDIGVALYHGLWWGRVNDAGLDFTNDIIRHYLRGYLSANPLSEFWLTKIPMFMRYRQICKLSWFYDPNSEDEHQRERIRNIENGVFFTGCEIDPAVFHASGDRARP